MSTQVAIIGAGPAGLTLSHLLARSGIESVVLEKRSRAEIEATIRAGVLEDGTTRLMHELGVGERVAREGLAHDGIVLRFDGRDRRIDLHSLTGGKRITLYPQHEYIKDFVAARLGGGGDLRFEVDELRVHRLDSSTPEIRYRDAAGEPRRLRCEFVVGCDGTHGVTRGLIPPGALTVYEHVHPFAWFGILCHAPQSSRELVYALHERGFALVSTRSAEVQRLYFQCDPAENPERWSEDRIWAEFRARLATRDGWAAKEGRIFSKVVLGMRSFVVEPMQHGRVFLAGDAAHVVPPTGAKGLNLAVADARVLATSFAEFYARGRMERLQRYSEVALRRVWKAQRFSWWLTCLMHRFAQHDAFQHRVQLAELDYLTGSRAGSTSLAENYVGLPFED